MTATRAPRLHPAAPLYACEVAQGKLDRREFLSRTTALGVTSAAAYGLLGAAMPTQAQAQAQQGGTLRMQIEVRALKDPRTYDWPQMSYITAGWLEYLVAYNNDGTFTPWLLAGWDVNDDATAYTLHVRPDVTWNDGTAFTAADVARNITRWCDKSVEGNSMATRMATLIDPDTGKAIDGAITATDDLTVTLTLPFPDITMIAGMSDYPAQIVPADFNADDPVANPKGTGPYLPEVVEVGTRAVLTRNTGHNWWGDAAGFGAAINRFEFIDYGTDPSAFVAAAAAGEVDVIYETVGEFVDILDGMGWQKSEVASGSTIVIRTNQLAEVDGKTPYADVRVRRAITMAVDPEVCLELGYGHRGVVARNMHIGPMHPEWADIPAIPVDPAAALALMTEAGLQDFEMELVSIDDDWRKNTTDAVAAQLRDAGFTVKRTTVPASTFWSNWTTYPFSSTDWNHRPLGTQTYALAYRSGEAWNETGFANAAFDALLAEANAIADADKRRVVMAKLQTILRDEGVILQPYWRSLYRHAAPGVIGAQMHIAYLPRLYDFAFAVGAGTTSEP
jgi:peptide/nickel transport system substrate-binding protein